MIGNIGIKSLNELEFLNFCLYLKSHKLVILLFIFKGKRRIF